MRYRYDPCRILYVQLALSSRLARTRCTCDVISSNVPSIHNYVSVKLECANFRVIVRVDAEAEVVALPDDQTLPRRCFPTVLIKMFDHLHLHRLRGFFSHEVYFISFHSNLTRAFSLLNLQCPVAAIKLTPRKERVITTASVLKTFVKKV